MTTSGRSAFSGDVSYTLTSNLVVGIVSALSVVVIPKVIGVEEYGYWQLFMFYSSYVLLLQLGLADGAYLRYGGQRLGEHPENGIAQQGLLLAFVQCALAVVVILVAPHLVTQPERAQALQLTAIFSVIANVRQYFWLHLQAVGEFRKSSSVAILDRAVYVGVLTTVLSMGLREFQVLIYAELIAKACSLVALLYVSRSLFRRGARLRRTLWETASNIFVGLKLTIANTSNMLIIGVIRAAIDAVWGVVVFGAVSLVLNFSSVAMMFVNAVGIVLFPTLRRSREKQLPHIYKQLRLPMSALTLALLMFGPLLNVLMVNWLPDYAVGARFLIILIPMIVFETRVGLLLNPFMKALRKENALLGINLLAVGVSVLAGWIFTVALPSAELAVASILIALALRAILAETVLIRRLQLRFGAPAAAELVLVAVYLVVSLTLGGWLGTLIYAAAYAVYLALWSSKIRSSCLSLRGLLRGFPA